MSARLTFRVIKMYIHKTLYLLTIVFSIIFSINVYASPGGYLGIKGGYKTTWFPEQTKTYDFTFFDGQKASKDYRIKTTSQHYFGNIHFGYLFPIIAHFQIGVQTGYTNYGSITIIPVDMPKSHAFEATGSMKNTLNSLNFYVVAQYDWHHYFIRTKLGTAYMINSIENNTTLVDSSGPAYFNKQYSADNSLNFTTGVSIGGYIGQHLSLALTYDHIFGKNYNDNIPKVADYRFATKLSAPTINLFGIECNYDF